MLNRYEKIFVDAGAVETIDTEFGGMYLEPGAKVVYGKYTNHRFSDGIRKQECYLLIDGEEVAHYYPEENDSDSEVRVW